MLWVEPVAAIAAGFLCSAALSAPLGDYLITAGLALLAVSVLRSLAAYHRQLDRIDAEVERADEEVAAAQVGLRDYGPLFANAPRGFPVVGVPKLDAIGTAPAETGAAAEVDAVLAH